MDPLSSFLQRIADQSVTLYPAQEEAILELFDGRNVILNTPTGSGKSLVAAALHHFALANHRVSVYTCPIKALVNEKFLSLCQEFGAENVGMMTGDASVNRTAPILCCTAEILANWAAREGENLKVDDVIMDEFHYYSDRERGSAWQLPLLILKNTRFLLMSATLGNMDFFARGLTQLNGLQTAIVTSTDRPVPLDFEYRETPLHETIQELLTQGKYPIYVVHFTQANAAEEAQNLLSVDFLSKEEKKKISEELYGVKFTSPYGKEIQRFIKHGVGLHHAGLLPRYRVLMERLAQKGLLKIICGTDTLGVGVNVPIRSVLLTKLCKYDGEKTALLSVRDFHQISGRAGRKGFDTQGTVVAQAPEHIVENRRMEMKAKLDPKKAKKMVKKTPPERGYVPWDQMTFERLIKGQPEPLVSRFDVTHGLLLNVLGRPQNGCREMSGLIARSHESVEAKRKHRKKAWQLFRSLYERKLVELQPILPGPGHCLRVNIDLQDDFSLHQTLALYVLDTLKLLDPSSALYALDILTLAESILESPELILRKQLDRVKTQALAEMKAAGMEYEERMEELEKLEHPKPLRDFIYSTFNEFSELHPWVGTQNILPKSIAREMFENYYSFADYIKEYDLQRAEGVLLRYLSEVTKVLVQTIPDAVKTEEVDEMIIYFAAMVKGVDSSLLDEWEKLRGRKAEDLPDPSLGSNGTVSDKKTLSSNKRALTVLVRNQVFAFLRAFATQDFEAASHLLGDGSEEAGSMAQKDEWAEQFEQFSASHGQMRTDFEARGALNTVIDMKSKPGFWLISQKILDTQNLDDRYFEFELDLSLSDKENKPHLQLVSFI
jgi:superfamily II RNA helicase